MRGDADVSRLDVAGRGEEIRYVGRVDMREQRRPDDGASLVPENIDDVVAHLSHTPLVVRPSDD